MKVPLSWLREFVDLDLSFDELVEVMGRNGLEVDEVRVPGAGTTGVVVARVLDVREHPDADRLVVVTVDDGDGERTVCAGARNIAAGDLVPYALPGATLPSPEGGAFEIGSRDMRGVTSDGMLCSARELQVADDHSGIMVLDGSAEPGTSIGDVVPVGDPVLDVAVPADRGDLHSVFGVARDLAAILDTDVRSPGALERIGTREGSVSVSIAADDGCSRYIGWVVDELTVGRSPWWLRRRLEVCGVRSISNLVDVTNYVMLEQGQPLHAFDAQRLRGQAISVRWAEENERLRTLDGRERTLHDDDLVIADSRGAVALAGVMGGEETEVGDATGRILLEAAAFDPTAIRRTSRRLDLVSEASIRFERGVDPERCLPAAARAVELLRELAGGSDAGMRAAGAASQAREVIVYDPSWGARLLGLDELDAQAQVDLLARSGVDADPTESALEVRPPSWRADLARPADVAEEVGRLHGYERIPAVLPPIAVRGGRTARQRAERDVRAAVLAAGFHEASTVPFVAEDALTLLAAHDAGRVHLENPLAKDAGVLRPSLAEGLLGVGRRNVGQGRDGLALCEIGRIFRPVGGALDEVLSGSGVAAWEGPDGGILPTQPNTLGLVAYGTLQGQRWLDRERTWTVFDLLSVFDEVAARLAPPGSSLRLDRVASRHPALHPGRTAALVWDGSEIGLVGQLHPLEADRRDLPASTVVGELLVEVMWAHLAGGDMPIRRAADLVRHPAMSVDVAVIVDEAVPYERVERAVRTGAGPLLDRLRWFDEYRGEQVGEGRRSLAFHLRLQAPDRQLADEDAEAVIDGVQEAVAEVGGTLRR